MPRKRTDTTARAHPNDYKRTATDRLKAKRYDAIAIQKCFSLYLIYNGKNFDKIEMEMRREYPGFAKSTIAKWESQFDWEIVLELDRDRRKKIALTDADELYEEVKLLRKRVFETVRSSVDLSDDLVKVFLGYARESRELLLKIKSDSDTLGAFVAMLERLLEWLPDYSIEARDALLQIQEEIINRAATEFSTTETPD